MTLPERFRSVGLMSAFLLLSAFFLVPSGVDAVPQTALEVSETSEVNPDPPLLVFDTDPAAANHQEAQPSVPKTIKLDLNKKLDWNQFRLQALDTQHIVIGPAKPKPAAVSDAMFGIESVPAGSSSAPANALTSAGTSTNGTAAVAAGNGTSLTVAEIPVAMSPLSSKDILSQFF